MEVQRSFDPEPLVQALSLFPEVTINPDHARAWLKDENNILLCCDKDFGMFNYEYPGLASGHYVFSEARGRRALQLAREMLNRYFVDHAGRVVRGITPVKNRKAIWMNYKLGFTKYDRLFIVDEDYDLFMITCDEFWNKNSPFLKIETKAE